MKTIRMDGEKLYWAFYYGKKEVIKRRKHLNKINVFPVADGDTGTNLAMTMQSIIDGTTKTSVVSDVSRGMAEELRHGRGCGPKKDYILLKVDHIGADKIMDRLPGIWELAMVFAGVDCTKEPIPVVPTAHYSMGGIPTNYRAEVVCPGPDGPETVVPGLDSSFRITSAGAVVGRLVQDRATAVSGRIGERAPMFRCSVRIRGAVKEDYGYRVAGHWETAPMWAFYAAALSATRWEARYQPVTLKARAEIFLKGRPTPKIHWGLVIR